MLGGFGSAGVSPCSMELKGGGRNGIGISSVLAPVLAVPLLRDSTVSAPACAAEIRLTLAVGDVFQAFVCVALGHISDGFSEDTELRLFGFLHPGWWLLPVHQPHIVLVMG